MNTRGKIAIPSQKTTLIPYTNGGKAHTHQNHIIKNYSTIIIPFHKPAVYKNSVICPTTSPNLPNIIRNIGLSWGISMTLLLASKDISVPKLHFVKNIDATPA